MSAQLKRSARITGAERTQLASDLWQRYNNGASIRTLAKSVGKSYGFVHRLLTECGGPLRPRGGSHSGRRLEATFSVGGAG